MPCGFQTETRVAAGYDDGLPAERGGGVGEGGELGLYEGGEEVFGPVGAS